MARRAIVLAPRGTPALLGSYGRALEALGWDVTWWSLEDALRRHVRFGSVGRLLSTMVPVEPWINKANRELIVLARDLRADLVIAAGAMPIRAGAIAQLKVSVPTANTVLLWPDPMQNLTPPVAQALAGYDVIGGYSREAIPLLKRLGGAAVIWLPFAADLEAFPDVEPSEPERRQYSCEVSFVGNYRPEREQALNALFRAGLRVKVWGEKLWTRFASNPEIVRRYYQGYPLTGADMVRAVRSSRVCLNVIDDTNYPAANMRAFEGPACRGTMLQSRAPELEPIFPEGRASAYFDNFDDLVAKARELVRNRDLCAALAGEAHRIVREGHTYLDRARALLTALEQTQ